MFIVENATAGSTLSLYTRGTHSRRQGEEWLRLSSSLPCGPKRQGQLSGP